ncbi:MAG TPA: DUF5666 domain-containing protein [Terriglobales bacterium]|nr:DUF5666 domain-containing protein [Terriglobales bacterium]
MKRFLTSFVVLLSIAFTFAGCGGSGSASFSGGGSPSAVFVTGEDAPLPSVLAFNVTINSITLNNSSTSVQVLAQPTTVDFARLLGLRTLLGFNTVAPGTYDSVTFQLSSPVISYLDLTTTPPSVGTINGTLTSSTVTVALPKPMAVAESGLAGLHMEFDLRQSIQLDTNGEVTGSVDPHINAKAVQASDDDAEITDLRGGLVSVNVSGNSFVLQRAGGHDITIDVNSNTQFNGSYSLGSLATPMIIEVDGTVQADGSILAEEVEVICTDGAFVMGHIVAVNPTSGPAQSVTLLVGEELPAISGVQAGFPATIDVSAVTDYDIRHFNNWFTSYLFNSSSLVIGQRILIGGTVDSSSNFTPRRVVLRRQGVVGQLVQGSVSITSGNLGSFQLQNNGLLGYVLNAPLRVQTGDSTRFLNVNGLLGLSTAGSAQVAAAGLMLKDQTSGNVQMWAHHVAILP